MIPAFLTVAFVIYLYRTQSGAPSSSAASAPLAAQEHGPGDLTAAVERLAALEERLQRLVPPARAQETKP